MNRTARILIVLAAVMGACGVMLAAASTHLPDASRLGPASSMLLFHATAVLGTVALADRMIIHVGIGLAAAFGFVIAAFGMAASGWTAAHNWSCRVGMTTSYCPTPPISKPLQTSEIPS